MDQQQLLSSNPTDWTYAAEGGKHALFRYTGNNERVSGNLLRIVKGELAVASSFAPTEGESSSCVVQYLEDDSVSSSQTFQKIIVRPLVGHCYLDLARPIRLPVAWCAGLYRRALASGLIPASRLFSWKTNHRMDSCEEGIHATLLRDYTQLTPHPRLLPSSATSSTRTIFSVEIKPKAGYITASPLVLPDHRCKYYRTRYALQQEMVQKGYVTKGWQKQRGEGGGMEKTCVQRTVQDDKEDAFIVSNYSPLDLFSGDGARMQEALKDLSENMQNNFRVWCNGTQMFGEYESPSDNACQTILNNLSRSGMGGRGNARVADPKSTLLDILSGTVARVLEKESLLSNVLSVQKLDVLDGDGAVMVYDRLVRLCGGSNTDVEKLLDEAALIAGNDVSRPGPSSNTRDWLGISPYKKPECNALEELLDEMTQHRLYLRKKEEEESCPDEDLNNASHDRCVEHIQALSKEACIYLLQNWLLSLALCDMSFFVSFQFLTEEEREVIFSSIGSDMTSREECQSSDYGGIASCSVQYDGLKSCAVYYTAKLVDCDPKPAVKLRKRKEVESNFKLLQTYS